MTTGDEPHNATAIRDALERERRDRELVQAVQKELETRKPPGWRLVPIEPTAEMLDAMEINHDYRFDVAETYGSIGIPKETCAEIYKAMIDAAPRCAEEIQ